METGGSGENPTLDSELLNQMAGVDAKPPSF